MMRVVVVQTLSFSCEYTEVKLSVQGHFWFTE